MFKLNLKRDFNQNKFAKILQLWDCGTFFLRPIKPDDETLWPKMF